MNGITQMAQEAKDALKEGKDVRIRFIGQDNWIKIREISVSGESSSKTGSKVHFIRATTADAMPTMVLIAPEHLTAIFIRDKS